MAPKVDFIAQLAGFIATVYALFSLSLGERDAAVLVLEVALLFWQLGSAIVWVIALRKRKTRSKKLTVVALAAIPIYLLVLFGLGMMQSWQWFTIWIFVVWWAVALYYFALTTLRAFDVNLNKRTQANTISD